MTNQNRIYCTTNTTNCSRSSGMTGEITIDKDRNYSCNVLKDGICSYLIELKNQESIYNALEKLIKTIETIKL